MSELAQKERPPQSCSKNCPTVNRQKRLLPTRSLLPYQNPDKVSHGYGKGAGQPGLSSVKHSAVHLENLGHDFSRVKVYANRRAMPSASLTAIGIQAKLAISQPEDESEREADRVAEQVIRILEPPLQQTYDSRREFSKCLAKQQDQEHQLVKRRHIQAKNIGESIGYPILKDALLFSSSQPLDSVTRAFFEPRFGFDFSSIRIHTDSNAAEAAESIQSRAFTVGNDIFFGRNRYNPQSTKGGLLLAHELAHTIQQNAGSTSGILIQRTLEEDINSLLERIMPSPDTAENRILIIEALCRMAMGNEDARISARRRILHEVFQLIVEESEASRLHGRLNSRILGDSLSEVFHDQLATATRNEMLQILQRRITRVNLVVEAAQQVPARHDFPQRPPLWSFGTPEEGDGILLNPSYWLVSYLARLGDITISADNQNRNGLSAWRSLQSDPRWTGRYDELTMDIRIIDSASDAIGDAWSERSADLYSMDCYIAANLVQLRGMYLYYLSQGPEQDRSPAEMQRLFDRDYTETFGLRLSGNRSQNEAEPPSTSAISELMGESSAMAELAQDPQERIPILSGPTFHGRIVPGDWVTIDSTDFIDGIYSYENAIYIGDNQFFGHPLGTFTPEAYASHIHRHCRQYRNDDITEVLNLPPGIEWPEHPAIFLRAMFVNPIGRPCAIQVQS